MNSRHLTYAAIFGAAVILVVSFWFTIGAQKDFAIDQGVDPGLANALPVCIEALIVVSGAVMAIRRMERDEAAENSKAGDVRPSWLARGAFFGAVTVTFAVNWAHGAPHAVMPWWVAPFLSAVPAVSLPVSLELALVEWLRVRGHEKPARLAKPRRTRPSKAQKPAVGAGEPALAKPAQAVTSGPPVNGDAPRNLTIDELRDRYPTRQDIDRLLAEHDGVKTRAAAAVPCAKSTFYSWLNELDQLQGARI